MRDGLDAPTFELPSQTAEAIRAFLDAQSRFKLAIWVTHEQRGADGPLYDHHVVLAVEDEDWATGDMRALDAGARVPVLAESEPTWTDIYPLSEVEALRSFGIVLWEETSPGDDPLDYRFTFEPFVPEPEATERFVSLLSSLPAVKSVGVDVARLHKGEAEVESEVRLLVDAPFEADVLMPVAAAARATVLAGQCRHSVGLGRPEGSMAILYGAPG